ncbi:hypothetical protein [Bailinhaonella thermotolerans]|uniref:hypothetical protein n=1 Tax=Bailinhaonella thermotolerans TaxID=1070861 RepID=UPI000E76C070|nr:hypothetical protein [Bailinhaonella thermotolerans]
MTCDLWRVRRVGYARATLPPRPAGYPRPRRMRAVPYGISTRRCTDPADAPVTSPGSIYWKGAGDE